MESIDRFVKRNEGALLPIIKPQEVESSFFMLRLTPFGRYNIEDVEAFIKTLSGNYVISKEFSKKDKEHYHILVATDKCEEDIRELIRDFLKIHFTAPAKRGDANKQYNLQECIDVVHSLTYLLKDGGELLYGEGINKDSLEYYKKLSYKKFDKESFAKELQELKDKFKEYKYSLKAMMEAVALLKAKYRQPIDFNYIYRLCVSCEIHNNPRKVEEYVDKFLSRLL